MKRLKIAEQIVAVLLFAVLIPFITIGVIISNISQQSVRKELVYSSGMISSFVANSVQNYIKLSGDELKQIASAISYFYYDEDIKEYLAEIQSKNIKFTNLKIIPSQAARSGEPVFDEKKSTLKLYANIDENDTLTAELKLKYLQEALENKFGETKQDIYILDEKENLIATNDPDRNYTGIARELPSEKKTLLPILFSKVKNQPLTYYALEKPNWTVVVRITPSTSHDTIGKARSRIVLSLVLGALFIFVIVGLYTYYLYINIRQLFKGIIAISKGNYDRKIRLLKSVFTPHEIVFLEKEFNYMTKKVSTSYVELSEKNLELKRLNEFRSSLVSAISHEFRTPLTSIIGYVSRLMRSDIKIDDDTKAKSLKVIKQQAQRLSRMVDDILVVPDIESFKLHLDMQELDLTKLLELSVTYVNSGDTEFDINMTSDLLPVNADKDRLIQILVNLCENAVKYNKDNAPIKISGANVEGKPCISILNKSDIIPKEMLNKLYDKFVRLDSELTRTTRGTGLGLFIVKGLCDAMNITVDITSSDNGFEVVLVFNNEPEPKPEPAKPLFIKELDGTKSEIVDSLFL